MDLVQLGDWVLEELPALNREILGRRAPREALTDTLGEQVLPELPDPDRLDPAQARRAVVLLGLVGASVSRHFQENVAGGKDEPERAFAGLTAGDPAVPFTAYFAALADRTGTGHCYRDSYASLVRWNVGTIEVRDGEHVLGRLHGEFNDGKVRSYTGTGGERRFFVLVKQGEAIEAAANAALAPLTDPRESLHSPYAVERVRLATALLEELRALFQRFAAAPPEQSMPADHFMDVFRQFAVHWRPDDIPPSGALDPEALKRDFLLGGYTEGYDERVRGLFPALLASERTAIDELIRQPALPRRLLDDLGVEPARLATAEADDLRILVHERPALAEWFRLLTAHGRGSGAHLLLSRKFLFKPQQQRDLAGIGDKPLVSNRAGTTGMTETFLQKLTRARHEHILAPLRQVLIGQGTQTPLLPVAAVSC